MENRISTNIKIMKLLHKFGMDDANALSRRFSFGNFETLCSTNNKKKRQRGQFRAL